MSYNHPQYQYPPGQPPAVPLFNPDGSPMLPPRGQPPYPTQYIQPSGYTYPPGSGPQAFPPPGAPRTFQNQPYPPAQQYQLNTTQPNYVGDIIQTAPPFQQQPNIGYQYPGAHSHNFTNSPPPFQQQNNQNFNGPMPPFQQPNNGYHNHTQDPQNFNNSTPPFQQSSTAIPFYHNQDQGVNRSAPPFQKLPPTGLHYHYVDNQSLNNSAPPFQQSTTGIASAPPLAGDYATTYTQNFNNSAQSSQSQPQPESKDFIPIPDNQTFNQPNRLETHARSIVKDQTFSHAAPLTKISPEIAKDIETLKFCANEDEILISILAPKTPSQMRELLAGFQEKWHVPLHVHLDSNTQGDFGKMIVSMTKPTILFLADSLHDAVSHFAKNEVLLVEILGNRSKGELQAIRDMYRTQYEKDLERDMSEDFRGNMKLLFLGLIHNGDEIQSDVAEDVKALYKAGQGKIEKTFINILTNRPIVHLHKVFGAYEEEYKKSFEKIVKSEFNGDLGKVMLALGNFFAYLVQSIENRPAFLASQFEDAVVGLGTRVDMLIRVAILSREPAMREAVKKAYQYMFNQTLGARIQNENLSMSLTKLFLALLAF